MKRLVIAICLGIVLGSAAFSDALGATSGSAFGSGGGYFAALEGREISSIEELAAVSGARPEPYYYEEAEERSEDPDREELRHFLHAKAASRRLVTQYDLRDCKVKNWDQACKFLTLISGPQIDSGNIWSEAETMEVIKYMQGKNWITKDFFVKNADEIVNFAAKACGYSNGDRDRGDAVMITQRYLEMVGETANGSPHTNLCSLLGIFIWDPYKGDSDRIMTRGNSRFIRYE
ncbi:MAG TPA: hypothetical protein VIO60_11770 [Rectinemataceae bacterium]